MSKDKEYKFETRMMHAGRAPEEYFGVVNPPIARTSTILYDDLAAYLDPDTKFRYGRINNPLAQHFEEAVTELEGGHHAISTASGFNAVTTSILAFVKAGDHMLLVDSCYPPTRSFAKQELKRFGIDVEFYDPLIGAGIKDLIRENTALIYMESPGSAVFEVQDVPAIVKVAKEHDILTIFDNTYSAGILFKPFDYGVNIVLQSAAKYIGGHSDINIGFAVADTEQNYKQLKSCAVNLGVCAPADDIYLAMRGLRTLQMRIKHAGENMRPVMEWFTKQSQVQQVYCPCLENAPGHEIWKRDFDATNGLFSVLFNPEYSWEDMKTFIDSIKLIPIGSSWGGYESLIQPSDMQKQRNFWDKKGIVLRFQIGNENPDDLIADLEAAIKNL